MAKLISCGDSFMSLDNPATDTVSFLERYCQQKNFEHVSLAKSGSTNFCIRLQIDEAIKQSADYIVIGATSSDRIDIPLPTELRQQNVGILKTFIRDLTRWHQVLWPDNRRYNRHYGLKNIEYRGYGCISELTVNNEQKSTVISDSLNNFVTDLSNNNIHNNQNRNIPAELIPVLENYVLWLHDEELAMQRDFYLLQSGIRELERLGIPYLFIPGPLRTFEWIGSIWVGAQPWDMPDGFNEDSVTHNPNSAHEKFCTTMLDLTANWQ